MATLRIRALPNGDHQFFRRAGLSFRVGSDRIVEVDDATAALLHAETGRLKVEVVEGVAPTPVVTDPPLPPGRSSATTAVAPTGETVQLVNDPATAGQGRGARRS